MHKITGGCTAVVSLFLKNKLFVSNAGDSRYSAFLYELIQLIINNISVLPRPFMWNFILLK